MFDPSALALQAELAARLILAAVLGAAIGLERELHAHPAGMRTHLLVSVGAALFTVVSIFGFIGTGSPDDAGPVDPTRIAAQVVTGIGFLGAGAILKYGTSIRGLTTAGSLWATAAIGMAAGAGQVILAVAGWAIVLFSLWPLNWMVARSQMTSDETVRIRLRLRELDALGRVTTEFTRLRAEVAEFSSERIGKDRYEVELDVRPQPGTTAEDLIRHVAGIGGVDLVEAGG